MPTAVRIPGASNYISTPDSAAVSITGDIEIRVKLALDDWTPATFWAGQCAKLGSWRFDVESTGILFFRTIDPVAGTHDAASTALNIADGSIKWIAVTRDVDNGSGFFVTTFLTSNDGVTWTTVSTGPQSPAHSIVDTTGAVYLGRNEGGSDFMSGIMIYAEIRNGIGGPVVAKFDPSAVTILGAQNPTTVVSSTGETWTMNGAGWSWLTLHDAAGTSAGTSSASATLVRLLLSSGTAAGTSSVSGTVTQNFTWLVAGTSAGHSGATADATVRATIFDGGTSAGSATASGTLIAAWVISGQSDGKSSASASTSLAFYRFEPPVVYDNPPVIGDIPVFPYGTPQQRFFSHMRSRPRGRTIILLKTGVCAVVDYPTQLVPGDPSEGDVWTEQGLAGHSYTDIARVFMGGHVNDISPSERDQLIACGYGSGITGPLFQ